jgi:ribosomal protein S18 acetylase RimI-like enzyme
LIAYLIYLGKKQGLVGCAAEVLVENKPMLHLLDKMGFNIEKKRYGEVYEIKLEFNGNNLRSTSLVPEIPHLSTT